MSLHPYPHYRSQRACMSLARKSSVLVFGLLLSGICSGAKARAEEGPLASALEMQAQSKHVSVAYLTTVSLDNGDVDLPDDPGAGVPPQAQAGPAAAPAASPAPAEDPLAEGRQTKRILYVVPNFRAVSADQHLPPQSVKEKFKTAMLDSFDYSSFIFVG